MSNIWKYIDNFSVSEKDVFGEPAFKYPNEMNPAILHIIDGIRNECRQPIILHATNEKDGHTENSQHYIDNAVDFHMQGINFVDAMNIVMEYITVYAFIDRPLKQYMGIGIYPDWNTPGFHLDFRGYEASWGRIGKNYVSFDAALKYSLDKFK